MVYKLLKEKAMSQSIKIFHFFFLKKYPIQKYRKKRNMNQITKNKESGVNKTKEINLKTNFVESSIAEFGPNHE